MKEEQKNLRFVINKKYRFKKDFVEPVLGKIPQGMTATFVCNAIGCVKFKLPNGKHIAVPDKSAFIFLEEVR